MSDVDQIIENVTFLPKSAAKNAAAFNVLNTGPVTYQHDVRRATQAKVWSEPETFVSLMPKFTITTHITPYAAGTDLQRRAQMKVFSEPETFPQAQRSYLLSTLILPPTITSAAQTVFIPHSVFVENISWIKAQRGNLVVVLLGVPAFVGSADIFSGQDTYGWPLESLEPPTFVSPQRASPLVLNTFVAYNPATDPARRQQSKWFGEPETFPQAQRGYYLVVNQTAFAYNPATDVTRLRRQSKFFSEEDTFPRPQPRFVGGPQYNFIVYNPATDVRRALQAKWYTDPDWFLRPAPFNALVINGTAASAVSPLQFSDGLDIYDFLNGSILVAWGRFTPDTQSYNIYVAVVPEAAQPVTSGLLESGAAVVASQAIPTTPLNYVFNQNVTGLLATVSGLQHASYNAGTQTVTPSLTYSIKVVAVINNLERGEIDRLVTPAPTSVMLTTPMKRLWPFPNTGLD